MNNNTLFFKLKWLFLAIFTLFFWVNNIYSAPYFGDIFELKQPDGTTVRAKLYGDEFYARIEGLDGYTLVRDPATNYLCYAKLNTDQSEFISTGVVYKETTGYSDTDIVQKTQLNPHLTLTNTSQAAPFTPKKSNFQKLLD